MARNTSTTATCSECGFFHCGALDSAFPPFCLTETTDPQELESVLRMYRGTDGDALLARAAAEVEGIYYGKLTRVEEIIAFANRIGAHRIGVASCLGLIRESQVFARVLRAKGLEPYTVACKVGAVDKTEIGIPEELKVNPGTHESLCNPILQARLLNAQKTQLNVVVGLCVGHDSLFIKYSEAPVTTLITKDRVLGHNPAAALYTSSSFYKRLMEPGEKL